MIDVNVHTGHWPFQRFPFSGLAALSSHLEENGIERAFVSHLGCVFYPDPDVYNRELIAAARRHATLEAVPVVNPHLPGWRDNLRFYADRGVRAVKIIPSFHNYRLYSRPVIDLVEALDEAGIRLMLQMRFEDERDRYFALNVYGQKIDEVVKLAGRFPETPIICLNAYLPEARELGKRTGNVFVDIAFAEWLFTLNLMLEDIAPERILFGSHTPILITKATCMKLTEAEIPAKLKRQIGSANAKKLLGG